MPQPETFESGFATPSSSEIARAAIQSSVLLQAYGRDATTAPVSKETLLRRAETVHTRDPELIAALAEKQIEGLHGTRSGPLPSILQYGLLPVSQHVDLPTPVITGEHWTQPVPRTTSHVVHWVFAESTRRYAENASPHYANGLSIHNYEDALGVPDRYIETIDPADAVRTYLEVRKRNARQFEAWLQSGRASSTELAFHEKDFPVVLGVRLDDIAAEDVTAAHHVAIEADSLVEGDCLVAAEVPPQNIKMLFVPEQHIEFTQQQAGVPPDTRVLSLHRLRMATGGI